MLSLKTTIDNYQANAVDSHLRITTFARQLAPSTAITFA